MDRISLLVAIAFFYSAPALAADPDRISTEYQYVQASYAEAGNDAAKPFAWMDRYEQTTGKTAATNHKENGLETDVGFGVAPMFDSYGVFRTGSNPGESTYFAVGLVIDELSTDEVGTVDDRGDIPLSYGFGVKKQSYNIEYMMSVDEENYEVLAVGLGYVSRF